MAKDKKLKLETLSQTSKKKKDFLIFAGIAGILALIGFSIFSFSLDVDESTVYKKRANLEQKKTDFKITPKENIKEAWAISVETTFKEQNKVLIQFMKDVKETRRENQKELIDMVQEAQKEQEEKIFKITDKINKDIKRIQDSIKESIIKQNNRIEELKINNGGSNISIINSNPEEDIILGEDLLPKINPNIKLNTKEDKEFKEILDGKSSDDNILRNSGTSKKNDKSNSSSTEETSTFDTPFGKGSGNSSKVLPKEVVKKKVSLFKINTQNTKDFIIKEKEKELSAIKKRLKKKNTYHVLIGLTQAYLITGVYAPAFSEGKSDPLPVLLQAEGDILIANDDTESIANCFFIGSAKGNMNSQTADIRLNRISCSLADGTKKIEGGISGWVIGENGIPGVPGELLHKNGAWLAKTFVAGFLQTFSQSLVAYAGTGGRNNNTQGQINIGDSLASSGAQSTADVFAKVGDYYLQMAEQIFPVIEVKAGRTVDILLKGGESLTVTDFNSADIDEIEADLKRLKLERDQDINRLKELGLSASSIKSKDVYKIKKSKSSADDLFN